MATLSSLNQLMIKQAENGYRYSIEPFLLANFVNLSINCRILDVGTGCGIITLLLATKKKIDEIVAIEIQSSLYNLAVKNISMNQSSTKIRLIHGDFIQLKLDVADRLFDIVIMNPPYRKLNSGRINPNREKAIARHELSIDLESLTERAYYFLKPGGVFVLAYPTMRLFEVMKQLHDYKLFPSRLRFIHSSQKTEAHIFLIEAAKGYTTDCVIESPLYIYGQDGSYTEEIKQIYASFNYFSRTHHIEKK